MTEHPAPKAETPSGEQRGPAPRHRTPRWVLGFLAAAALIVVVVAVVHLSGGGMMNHTP